MRKNIKKGYKGPKVVDTESFILKSKWQHGDVYDYSETVYKKSSERVCIICKKHGRFQQMPSDHTSKKAGCPDCKDEGTSKRCKTSTEDFIKKSKEVHGDKYDYSKVVYETTKKPVIISCEKHGDFEKMPYLHIHKKSGCHECYMESIRKPPKLPKENKYTTEYFVERSLEIHEGFYSYEKSNYVNNSTKTTITCPLHGDFLQKPNSHLNGSGCKECRKDNLRVLYQKSAEEFSKEASEIFDNKYDYSKVVYKSNKYKVEILCPHHGSFWQKPNNHLLAEFGCPVCADKESGGWGKSNGFYSTDKPSNFYLIHLQSEEEDFLKVGLSKNLDSRHRQISNESGYEVSVIGIAEGSAKDLFDLEFYTLHEHGLLKYEPRHWFAGVSECFDTSEQQSILEIMEEFEKGVR